MRDESGQYRAVLASGSPRTQIDYLVAGNYSIDNGDGGPDVGPFRLDFVVPSPIIWANRAAFLRATPLTFTWSGGDPDSYVVMSSLFANNYTSNQVLCVAENRAGRLTVPAVLFRGLTGTMVGGDFGNQPFVLSIGTLAAPGRFSARDLDIGLVTSIVLTNALYDVATPVYH